MSGLILGQIRYFDWNKADVTSIGPDDTWLHTLAFVHRGPRKNHAILNLYGFPTEGEARASARAVQALARNGGLMDTVLLNRVRPLRMPTTTPEGEGS